MKENSVEAELTYLLISAWSHREKEGSEHQRERRQ